MKNFGRYQIIEQIGAGAMGTVYKAVDPMMDRDVAIKTILTHAIEGPQADEFRDRFFREARAAGRLAHPGIVTMYDVSEQDGTPFLVMEYVAGRNLQSILQEGGRMDVDRIYDVAVQLAEALDYAHKNGVIHRDIKPSNILMTQEGRVKIADFGVARLAESQVTFTGGQLLGTPAFMAPEQFTGVRIDARADLFAAGVVIYWMATGDKPFTGETLLAVQYKVVNTDPVPPRVLNPIVSRALESVILKTLAKDPAERYQSGEALAEDLRAARANRQVTARPVTRPSDDTPTVMVRPSTIPLPAPAPAAPAPPSPPTADRNIRDDGYPGDKRWRKSTVWAVVVLAIVFSRFVPIIISRRGPKPPQVNTTVAPPEPGVAPTPAKKPEAKKRTSGDSQSTRQTAAVAVPEKAAAKPDSITLELVAQDRSNVVFRAEGQPTQTLIMKAGDAMTLRAQKEATLSITNAPALVVKLNGNPVSLGDHKSGQWLVTPEGIDDSRSILAKSAGPSVPFSSMPPVAIPAIDEALFGRGNTRTGMGSPAVQKQLAESPGSARLQITSSSIPPFLTVMVRADSDVLFRRDATAMPPRGRPDPAAMPSTPLTEERLLPAGSHKIHVSVFQGALRVGQPQELTVTFTPGQPRTLTIDFAPDRGNPQFHISVN